MLAKEHTNPLSGVPYFRSVGIIKAMDKKQNRYNIGEVAYERFDEQNFQYVFTPYWNLIEYLPRDVFDGIPGIDMEIKKEQYYRVNMTPSFISKRTPSEAREDIKELLDEVKLDYYDRFEWLLRTDRCCGDDNFVVERKRDVKSVFEKPDASTINLLQPGDRIILNRLCDIAPNRQLLSESVFRMLQSGAEIVIREDNITFSVEKGAKPLYLLERMMQYSYEYDERCKQVGIAKAKNEEKYKGRKRIAIDKLVLKEIVVNFEAGIITEQQALERMKVSRSTFYRRMSEWKKDALHKGL